jgi:tryptophan-rich sensory protein
VTNKTAFIVIGLALLVVYMVGSGLWVSTGDSWYRSLQAPSFQPPDWVFGVIWPYNFLMIAVSLFSVSKLSSNARLWWLIIFGLSVGGALNWAYQFYVSHNLALASLSLLSVPLLTVPLVIMTFRSSILVGLLLLPYQVWVSIATALSFSYAAKN